MDCNKHAVGAGEVGRHEGPFAPDATRNRGRFEVVGLGHFDRFLRSDGAHGVDQSPAWSDEFQRRFDHLPLKRGQALDVGVLNPESDLRSSPQGSEAATRRIE